MPELPEVETIARGLAPLVVGRTIEAAEVTWAKSCGGCAETFASRVVGRRIEGVRRRGKMLLVDLDRGMLVAHLKMTGRLWVPPEDFQADNHTHIKMRLSGGVPLHFRDVRKFGWLRCLSTGELAAMDLYRTMGPEPLELDAAGFRKLFAGRRGAVKALLLNQKVIAGVGNIYADEALFTAKIRPDAKADRLSAKRLDRLYAALRAALEQGIAENGASFRDYVNARGDAGSFQNSFQVYGKKGHPCPRCQAELQAATVAGRTSTYCPRCQKG
ncbi:bifunctional DNA-formamidopyrimidine glycosylase/DNA-(apurinic or apyrimidinic site) lyase [Desulfohalovibrio reitneri]|uniref:bifunctional DNA-formamidopyrimidine glycosylase/DNA-(apurinic or apyrimidinic site) lyase n=1 Tax=Desulfohalovibrio reitneri TaxID=1307759 RepID=UPI0004A6FA1C|nr:bifunctional DNA-formamidopyrimidine glycosylase/DNA-(apurinic or apyrimidinic site) lyase [Desulfohalovibrio reitneri]